MKDLLANTCKSAGCGVIKGELILLDAKRHGIKEADICRYRIWELSTDRKKKLAELKKAESLKKKEHRNWLIGMLSRREGISEGDMRERYKEARKHGVSERMFVFHEYYKMTPEELKTFDYDTEKLVREKAAKAKNRDSAIRSIMEKTGWSEGRVRYETMRAYTVCGCSEKDYFLCRMWEKSDDEIKKYFTNELKTRLWYRYAGSREGIRKFSIKKNFAEVFRPYLGRKVYAYDHPSYEEFLKITEGQKCMVFKPRVASKGHGFIKLTLHESEEKDREIYDRLAKEPDGVLEEYLAQHPDMAAFHPDSVNTVRILTSVKDGIPHILCAIMRIGVEGNVDNWSQGGITVGIDTGTGKLCTNGADVKGNIYTRHPVSGIVFKGYQIPGWENIKDVCLKAALVVEDMQSIGWDVAVKEDGEAALIEGNHGPSAMLMQEPFADEGIGLLENILPYVDGIDWSFGDYEK